MTLAEFVPFLPEIFLAVAGFAVLLLGIPMGRTGVRPLSLIGVVSLAVTGVLVWMVGRPVDGPVVILGGMLAVDQMAVFFKLLMLAASAVALMMAAGFLERSRYGGGEYVSLVLFATLGTMIMASGANLASLYVGLELMALSVYVLVGYFKLEVKSNEGAVKYFVLGAASSAILLYGISLVYGSLGTLDLEEIRASLVAVPSDNPMLVLGIALVGFGMLFKVAAVPFHVWTPDAYEGAPTPVTAFISVAPKAAAFAMFMRIFLGAFGPEVDHWRVMLWVASAATMIYGNVAALTQDNVKRMLAYSSIAHAGYALMGLVAANAMGAWALLMYMLVYAFMNLGAFGFVILLESKGYAGEEITDYAGLARRHPTAALGMLIFMLALAGIPPTAGFMGKLYLFAAAVEGGYVVLTVIAVIMSAVSLYYYFRIVLQMYMRDGLEEGAAPAELLHDRWTEAMIAICVVITLAIGIYPAPVVGWAKSAIGIFGL
ncbi:MAG: NADH-quinone oxidoreductase subunit N [Acidobacteria bacterium]|nr:NADH-quinone oxidoreductase subunit N [Candidatus Sulfomarinibacter sp. MAG AM2]